jgi:restriction system protein
MIPKRGFFRVMLGKKSIHAEECLEGGFIGGDWGIDTDLTNELPENWRVFNKKFIPVYLEKNPGKSRVAAGLACGMLHTICKGIKIGDVVLCRDESGSYNVGEVTSDYHYEPGVNLPHRRSVNWYPNQIDRDEMSQSLRNSAGSIGTVSDVSKYAEEIERILEGNTTPSLIASDESVEDPTVFALEKHLEEFLVHNWSATELGKNYDIFSEDGELVGQQYPSDTGPIDILALSKDGKELLVVELKKGRASDVVVGQVQRYMGYVLEELAEPEQTVRGVILALEDDIRLQRSLKVTNNIDFYRYEVSFSLEKG